LVAIWAKLLRLDAAAISVTANFFELGGHSLIILNIIAILKNEHDIHVKIQEIYEYQTIRLLSKKLGLRKTKVTNASNLIVRLNSTKLAKRLFVIHPLGGRVDCYHEYAKTLAQDISVFGIQAPCFSGIDFRFTSIVELAKYYVKAIKTLQPQGPYKISGWSSGGQLAFYIAALLKLNNEEVDYLSLYDPTTHYNRALSSDQYYLKIIVTQLYAIDVPILNKLKCCIDEKCDGNELVNFVLDKFEYFGIFGLENRIENERYLNAGLDFFKAERPKLKPNLERVTRLIVCSEASSSKERTSEIKKHFPTNNEVITLDVKHTEVFDDKNVHKLVDHVRMDLNRLVIDGQL